MINNPGRIFWLFIVLHVVSWTLVPTVVNGNLPLDVVEALAWGREWEWGYVKHPPLSAWIAEIFGWLSGGSDWGLYLGSQVCVAVAFWAMWRLSKEFLEAIPALISVLLMEGVYYHNFTSPELNVNVVLLACWTLTILCFYRAIQTDSISAWVATGLFAGLGFLSKYLVALLLVPMFLYLLWNNEQRTHLRRPGLWIGLAIFLAIALPHLLWMADNQFITITYGMRRAGAGGEGSWLDHIAHPLRFLGAQVVALLPSLLLLSALGKPTARGLAEPGPFLVVVGLGPLLGFLLLSLVTGLKLRSMWGTPLLAISGLLLMVYFAPAQTEWRLPRFTKAWFAWFLFTLFAYCASTLINPHVRNKGKRTLFPGREMAQILTEHWHVAYSRPLQIIVADAWLGGNLGWYSSDRPSTFLDADTAHARWMDDERVRRDGAILLWDGGTQARPRSQPDLTPYRHRFGQVLEQDTLVLGWQSAANLPAARIHWAMVPPQK